MGHADTKLVMDVYTKAHRGEKEQADALRLNRFLCRLTTNGQETGEEQGGQTLVDKGFMQLCTDYFLTTI